MRYKKPNLFFYRVAQFASWLVAKLIFRRRILRNELKHHTGSFVVIANHQAALDFVNLIGSTRRPMSFVISNCFYNTLPIKGFLTKMGVIPKQQFQTSAKDLKNIKAVIDAGEGAAIYPAGRMCEEGLSTPIPAATYKFLKWLDTDVYVARTSGTYFVMPKWGKGFRPGRTYMDIYRLFSKEELTNLSLEEIKAKTDAALLFDAYREQEGYQVDYQGGDRITGLEQVLYQCPHCGTEFSMHTAEGNKLYCDACGFTEVSDRQGFLHRQGTVGTELRYVSDWSRSIYQALKESICKNDSLVLNTPVAIHMIDYKACKFRPCGKGQLTLSKDELILEGTVNDTPLTERIPIGNLPSLPFSPGKHLELQQGQTIYRCLPENGRLVMKLINMVKIYYELSHTADQTATH